MKVLATVDVVLVSSSMLIDKFKERRIETNSIHYCLLWNGTCRGLTFTFQNTLQRTCKTICHLDIMQVESSNEVPEMIKDMLCAKRKVCEVAYSSNSFDHNANGRRQLILYISNCDVP